MSGALLAPDRRLVPKIPLFLHSEAIMSVDTMTFGETFRAIRDGDIGVIIAFSIECLIMASPLIIVYGAWVCS